MLATCTCTLHVHVHVYSEHVHVYSEHVHVYSICTCSVNEMIFNEIFIIPIYCMVHVKSFEAHCFYYFISLSTFSLSLSSALSFPLSYSPLSLPPSLPLSLSLCLSLSLPLLALYCGLKDKSIQYIDVNSFKVSSNIPNAHQ